MVRIGLGDIYKLEESTIQKILEKAFSDTDAVRLLSIEKDDYKKELFSLYKDNIIDQYYGLKIQYLYPFISGKDFTYIPSPYLVVNAGKEQGIKLPAWLESSRLRKRSQQEGKRRGRRISDFSHLSQ